MSNLCSSFRNKFWFVFIARLVLALFEEYKGLKMFQIYLTMLKISSYVTNITVVTKLSEILPYVWTTSGLVLLGGFGPCCRFHRNPSLPAFQSQVPFSNAHIAWPGRLSSNNTSMVYKYIQLISIIWYFMSNKYSRGCGAVDSTLYHEPWGPGFDPRLQQVISFLKNSVENFPPVVIRDVMLFHRKDIQQVLVGYTVQGSYIRRITVSKWPKMLMGHKT